VVSDSPHDICLVCGSRSLFNIARILGGRLPKERASLVTEETAEIASSAVVLSFPNLTDPEGRRRAAHDNLSSKRMRPMKLSAECYSGRKAGERPIRFWLAKFEPMTGISIILGANIDG